MAVDMVRRSYTTTVRPFRNSDREVEIIWYPAADDAPDLPFPSAINSLDWVADAEKSQKLDVGEVFGSPRKWAGKKVIPYAVIDHLCGPQIDFEKGAIYDPLAPDIEFDFEKFPLCCLPQELGQGGIEWSGVGEVEVVPASTPSNTCNTAIPLNNGVPQTFALDGPGDWWFTFPGIVHGGGVWHVDTAILAGLPFAFARFFQGLGCGTIFFTGNLTNPGCTDQADVFSGMSAWLRIEKGFPGSTSVTFTPNLGHC